MTVYELAKILNIPSRFVDNTKLNYLMGKGVFEYKEDKVAMINKLENQENSAEKLLYLILNLAIRAKEEYKGQGISEQIWLDTMSDIRIWQKAYEDKYNQSGILEHSWVLKSIDRELFKLGSLQFEKIKLENEVNLKDRILQLGSLALNTHIQKGEDISPNKIKEAYNLAKSFFDIDIFVCDSWLLCQDLKNLLPKDSNIINFQNYYELVSEIRPHSQMEERVFGCYYEDKSKYQEDTNLQKNLKNYLISGHSVSMAKGYFEL